MIAFCLMQLASISASMEAFSTSVVYKPQLNAPLIMYLNYNMLTMPLYPVTLLPVSREI